jgi:UDP-glucose 4-epimerase
LKILVTGGAGFIGRNLAEHLLKNNEITIYDDLSNSTKEKLAPLIKNGAKFIKGDILDFDLLSKVSQNMELVIHLAAKSDVSESVIHPEITSNVNLNGTINVLKCCAQNKIKKIIFASSAAVYGDCKDLPIKEESKTEPLSPYGASKIAAENEIKKYANEFGFDAIILRMFNVYGVGQNELYSGVISVFLKNIAHNKPLIIYGDGKQTRDFISIYDIVEAFDCAIVVSGIKTYNIASGKSVSINKLAEILSARKKIKIIYKGQKKGDIRNSVADVTLAEKELGFYAKRSLQDEFSKL